MSLLSSLGQYLGSGDPIVKTWFLVQQSWIPFVFSAFYVFFVRRLGPYLMQKRQPMDLRKLMVVYNFSIVAVYIYAVYTVLYNGFRTDCFTLLCIPVSVSDRKEYYKVISALWIIYALKYVEYADTVFYVLRKKFHLISHLHVIHHAALPIICWFMFRTERTGFQIVPAVINSCIHIIMYTYYALSAMGPKFQKILWWKRYLTLLQMAQFVVILFLMSVVAPAVGCKSSQEGTRLTMFFAALFLLLFYNFYAKTYRTPLLGVQHGKSNDVDPTVVDNGPKQGVVCSTSRKDSWPRHRF